MSMPRAVVAVTLLLIPSLATNSAAAWRVRTLAGPSAGPGHSDGNGAAARFSAPARMAVACDGSVLVAGRGDHTIRRVTPGGEVTTLAGIAWAKGRTDGPASEAMFSHPEGIAVAPDCSVLVADRGNDAIRRISVEGAVSTLAGTFNQPSDVAIDSSGVIYVADTGNRLLRRIGSDGVISSIAGFDRVVGLGIGSGGELAVLQRDPNANSRALLLHSAAGAETITTDLGNPTDVVLDADGSFLVSDGWGTVRRVARTGASTVIAGVTTATGEVDGPSGDSRILAAGGVAVAGGAIYFSDSDGHTIRAIRDGVVSTVAGQRRQPGYVDGPAAEARFRGPGNVVGDPFGNVFVVDGSAVRRIAPDGAVSLFAGADGQRGFADGVGTAARFRGMSGIAIDAAGNLYVSDEADHVVRKITPGAVVTTLAGSPGVAGSADGTGSAARFRNPYGLAAAPDGTVFVADTLNHTIRRISPSGAVTTIAGAAGRIGTGDGPAIAPRFNTPVDVDLDVAGNVYVVDENNFVVQKIEGGEVRTVGSTRRGFRTWDLAVAEDGTIYTAETESMLIRRISGAVNEPFAGMTDEPGAIDGMSAASRLYAPFGVDVAPDGRVLIADSLNYSVRVVEPVLLPVIESFDAAPQVVRGGEASRLTWSVSGATSITITPGPASVEATGSLDVSPDTQTTYVLTAIGENGTTSSSVTVYLRGPRQRALRR